MPSRKPEKTEIFGKGAVRYRIVGPEDKQMIGLEIDYSEAPVPPHYYVADYFFIKNLNHRVLLTFGKFDQPQNRLRSKLEIYVPALSFIRIMLGSTQQFHETMQQSAEKLGFLAALPGDPDLTADKVQTLQSNNILMAHIDGESMIDFFYMSPRDLHFGVKRHDDIQLEALARVMIDPPIMLAILDNGKAIATELSKKFVKGDDYDFENESKVEPKQPV